MNPFIGQIVMFGGNFAPRGWAFCDGQLLAINQYSALFSILGTTYGGDGRTSFALPGLRGRVPLHPGTGAGLPNYNLGQKGGNYQEILNVQQIPAHNHHIAASEEDGSQNEASGHYLATSTSGNIYHNSPNNISLGQNSVTNTGGGQAHNNMQPFLGINFIIALQGVFPSRN
jgi:microcystin-dependent protein